ncbi:MAG: imidazoleglycerol-phosphate dehydratase HisB [Pseudomonadota bacterium]
MTRKAEVGRDTKETKIACAVDLDGTGVCKSATGVGFFDHMVAQLARHGRIDITLKADGDTHIDDHHTVEDCGYAIGGAIAKALGDRGGIARYGEAHAPMDETLVRCVVDLSGRPALVWRVDFATPKIGTFDVELCREFFKAFTNAIGGAVHVERFYGANDHHTAEGAFKALARALRAAMAIDPRAGTAPPSTKGVLGDPTN